MKLYEYRTFPADALDAIVGICMTGEAAAEAANCTMFEDGLDGLRRALKTALAAGFRWVRTDFGRAVFEREIEGPPSFDDDEQVGSSGGCG